MKKINNEKGITLVALVIVIVIVLILAGISISSLTNTGIIGKANEAKKQMKRSQITEWLELALINEQGRIEKTNLQIIQDTQKNIEDNKSELEKIGKINEIGEVKTDENGENKEPYFFVTIDNDVFRVENSGVTFVGEDGTVSGKVTGLTEKNTSFSYSTKEWTNESVTVTVSTTVKKFTLQTSTDNINWSDSNSQEFENNGIIYARLTDGKNVGKMYSMSVTNIDRKKPNDFEPTTTSTTNKITVSATTTDKKESITDGESGIDGYRFSKDGGNNWTEYQTSGTYVFDNMLKDINGSTYDIVVQAKDKAQNVTTSKMVQATTSKNMKYYVTGANKLLCTILDKNGNTARTFFKYKEDGAIAAMAYTRMYGNPDGTDGTYTWFHPIIVSTTEDGAKYYGDSPDEWYNTGKEQVNKIEYNGTQYYYSWTTGWVVLKLNDWSYDYSSSLITINESTNPYNGDGNFSEAAKESAIELIKKYLSE